MSTWEELNRPQAAATFRKTVAESDVHLFAGVFGDFSGVHTDETFAAATRFGRRIAHGAYSVAMISAAASRLTGAAALPVGYDIKFRGPVLVGDTVAATVTVSGPHERPEHLVAAARVVNQDGAVVVEGTVLLRAVRPGAGTGGTHGG